MAAKLLSNKDKTMHPRAQIQKLVRIGRRATSKADWYRELIEDYERNWADDPAMAEPEQIADLQRQIVVLEAKAAQAAKEILRLSNEHNIQPGR